MKKSILYSAVALVLVAAALFFAIFGTNGAAYNYAKKKVEKNLSGLVYTGFDLSGPQLATVEEKDIVAKLAAMVAGAASKTTSDENPTGYDIVRLNYWGTYEKEDGSVVTFTESKLMNPASPVQVQLQSDTELAKIFGEKLNNISFSAYSYNTVSSGYMTTGDVAFVTYLTTGAKEQTPYKQIELTDKATVDATYGAGFFDTIMGKTIGTIHGTAAAPIVCGDDKSYDSIKVEWVARTSLVKDTPITADDVVFATVTQKDDAQKEIELSVRVNPDGTYVAFNSKLNDTASLPAEVISAIRASKASVLGNVKYVQVTDFSVWAADTTYYTKVGENYNAVDQTKVLKPEVGTTYYTKAGDVYTAVDSFEQGFASGIQYFYKAPTYTAVDTTKVTAPAAGTSYYTKDGETYTKAEGLTAWAEGVTYYTFSEEYTPVKTTGEGAKDFDPNTTYYIYVGDYSFQILHVVRKGATGDDVKESIKALEITYTYPADSEAKDLDGNSLAGKEVTFHVLPLNKYAVSTDFHTLINTKDLSVFTSEDGQKLVKIHTASEAEIKALKDLNTAFGDSNKALVTAFVTAYKLYKNNAEGTHKVSVGTLTEFVTDVVYFELKDVYTAVDTATVTAPVDGVKYYTTDGTTYTEATGLTAWVAGTTYYTVAKDYVKVEGVTTPVAETTYYVEETLKATYDKARAALLAAKADQTKAVEGYESAYNSLVDAVAAYDKDVKVSEIADVEKWLDEPGMRVLKVEAEDNLKKENVATYREAIVKIIWDKLLADTEFKLPRRAVRIAYNDLMDSHKQSYYETEANYQKYSSFRKYMIGTLGEDYKDEVRKQAEENVTNLLLIYSLAHEFDIDLSVDAVNKYYEESDMAYMYSFYIQYGMARDQFTHAYAFDKVMYHLMDNVYQIKASYDDASNS